MSDLARLVIAVDSSSAKDATKDLDKMATTADKADDYLGKMGRTMAGIAVSVGIGLMAKQLYETNAEFQRLSMALVTVTKSQERANQVFDDLQQFAATTPYQLREVTQAYVLMRARGLDPTMDTMRSMGNLASAMSRPLLDTVNAVGSLAAGEIEPIKQLGFQAIVMGDKVRISSDGVAKLVDRNAYAISKAVAQISDAKFAGGMERQINTLGGAFSNLQDQIDITLYKVGQGGFNSTLITAFKGVTAAIDEATPRLTQYAAATVNGSISAAKFTYEHRDAVFLLGGAYAAVKVGQTLSEWSTSLSGWVTKVKAAHTATIAYDQAGMMLGRTSANANLATKAWSSGIAALGGPVGATIALLGVLAVIAPMAWEASKSGAQKASEEADKYLVRLREEVSLLDRKKQLQGAGRKDEAGMDDATIKALSAKEKYAGELQSKLAAATALRAQLEPYAGMEPGRDHGYQSAVAQEVTVQNRLNQVLSEYNEIAMGANRIKADAAQRSAANKSASEAEAKEASDKAKSEMEALKSAQEQAQLLQKGKDLLKSLKEESATYGMTKDQKLVYDAKKTMIPGGANNPALLEVLEQRQATREAIEMSARQVDAIADVRNAQKRAYDERQKELEHELNMEQTALDLAQPTRQAWLQLADDMAALEFKKGDLSLEGYTKAMDTIRLKSLALRAEEGQTWAIIGQAVVQSSTHATDAMVRWMDNLDGVGRSWKTLGDTVRNVITDMLIQMQRAVIQQQVMDPLIKWGLSAIGGAVSSYGPSVTAMTTGVTDPGAFTPLPVSGSMQSMGKSADSGQTIITINNNGGGGATSSSQGTGQNGAALGKMIESAVMGVMVREKRPGGLLAGA